MSFWNRLQPPPSSFLSSASTTKASQFFQQFPASQKSPTSAPTNPSLPPPSSAQGSAHVNSAMLDTFQKIPDASEQRKILNGLSPQIRQDLLGSINPVLRDQLLGGSPFKDGNPISGPEFQVNWSNVQPKKTTFDPATAHAAAVASKRCYEPNEVVKKEYEAQGFKVQFFDKNGTQAFLATRGDQAILSFRGTQVDQMQDLVADANAKLKPAHGGNVHAGFAKALDEVWPDITKALEKEAVGKDKPLLLTGHSLGGALATLAGTRLQEEKGITPNGLYTFGSPRVGDGDFAEAFQASSLGERTWRFRNNNDGVTIVPPPGKIFNYTHVGTEIYFDNQGSAHADLPEDQVCDDRKEAFSSVTEYFLKKHNRGHQIEHLWDHGMAGYVRHVYANQDFQTEPSRDPKK